MGAEELATTQQMGRPSSRGAGDMEGRNSAAAEGRDDGGVSAAAAREESAGAMVLGDGAASGGAGGRAAEREGDGDRARRWGDRALAALEGGRGRDGDRWE